MNGRFRSLVICYHAVTDRWNHPLAVGAETLERQLAALVARGYRPATAGRLLGGGKLLHVTFDDAFRSVAAALRALERLRVPATVFACADYADRPRPLGVPELAAEVKAHPGELLTMGWDELRGLADRGLEIGSHSISHAHLLRLSDAELRREVAESRERIEAELGRPCRLLAYPYGEHDARVRSAARAAGYEAAFALPGRAAPVDRFALPRVGVYRKDGHLRLRLKASTLARLARAR
ncbi:MAG: polysaccharide deacetylase family protein [Gaiellaceae bacterium]